MTDYYTVLTTTGENKFAGASTGGPRVRPDRVAVGDGGGPDFYNSYYRDELKPRTSLVNQQYVTGVNDLRTDPDNPAWIVVDGAIPADEGGYNIREVGVIDEDGDLIAIGRFPQTYKPVLASGAFQDMIVRIILEVGDTDSVTLQVDPSAILATHSYVDDQTDTTRAFVQGAISDIGVIVKEQDKQKTLRHQSGTITFYNRGIRRGCDVSTSDASNRNLSLAPGSAFLYGRIMPVDADENAASVPSNDTGMPGESSAYLFLDDGRLRLATTPLDTEAPDDVLVLTTLSIDAGSTDASDPTIDNVTLSDVARVEPEWPDVQTSPPHVQRDFDLPMETSGYELTFDVTGYEGGEHPVVSAPKGNRASNSFRANLASAADTVSVRYLAHLMDQ